MTLFLPGRTPANGLLLLLLVMTSIALAQPAVLSEKRLAIFTLGDSNGTYPHSWPRQLAAALPNAQVVNISQSGRTIGFVNNGDSTLNSLLVLGANLTAAVQAANGRPYDFIVIDLGTNDGKAVFANRQADVPGNLSTLIRGLKTCPYAVINRAKIVIISPTPYGSKAEATEKYAGGRARVQAMSEAFSRVARQYDCLFVNGLTIPGLDIETMTTDGLHLDAIASRKLIEPVVALMIRQVDEGDGHPVVKPRRR